MNKITMPRKQKVQEAPVQVDPVDQLIEPVQDLSVDKPKKTRKTKISDKLPETIPPAPVEKKTRAPSKWVSALKKYNEGRSGYIIPKKGTPEYDDVRALMG